MPEAKSELMEWSRHPNNGFLIINRYQDLYDVTPELIASGGFADAGHAIAVWADSHVVTVYSFPAGECSQVPVDDELERLVPLVAAMIHEMRGYWTIGWFDAQGRPWWTWRGSHSTHFLRRDLSRGSQFHGDINEILFELDYLQSYDANAAFKSGKIPVCGIGGRTVFVVPLEPYLEPWKSFLELGPAAE